MKFGIIIILAVIFTFSFTSQAQMNENEAVMRAALDYVEGVYEVDPSKIERSVHPDLVKRGFFTKKDEKGYFPHTMTFKELVELSKSYNKKGQIPKDAPKEIYIYDVSDQTASAKIVAIWGIDYMQLAKYDGKWKIVNILWQSPPKGNEDAKTAVSFVNKLFDKMAAHKPEEILALHTADAQLVAVIKSPDGKTSVRTLKADQFAKQFSEKKSEIKEVMYDAKAEVHGDLATVSGRYVFFVNQKISHCGINAFHLVRTDGNWKIAGASTTIEPKGCTTRELEMKSE